MKAGADLVALGKENGYDFNREELNSGWKELQESDEGLTEFELDLVSGGSEPQQWLLTNNFKTNEPNTNKLSSSSSGQH